MRLEVMAKGRSLALVLDPSSGLDVAALVVDGADLSPGAAIPSDGDPRIDRALRGFLFTCGPDHIRHPERTDAGGLYPLHGSLSGTAIAVDTMVATAEGCSGSADIALADGGRARLTRHWSIDAGSMAVRLADRIENIGAAPFPPMWMYHLNMAGALFDAGTRISGAMIPAGSQAWRFGDGESAHVCLPVPSGGTDETGWAAVRVGPFAALGGHALDVRFAIRTLPFLQMWRCQRGAADVVSIEPVSHRIARRSDLAAAGELPRLAPGAGIDYALSFRLTRDDLA